MKHIFIVNPQAGLKDHTDEIRQHVDALRDEADCEIYVTKCAGDATSYVRQRCLDDSTPLRFYACGGDGTINEVVSGVIGHPHAEMSCIPVGSGNDYVKYYGGAAAFDDFRSLLHGHAHAVDVMKITHASDPADIRYSINVSNFGFDAIVCKNIIQMRRHPIFGGRHAYTAGIVKALFGGRRTRCRITVDGETMYDSDILFCTLGNGSFVGGAYNCSPRSKNDDGLIEVCTIKPLSLLRFISMIGMYKNGTFIDNPKVQDKVIYRQGRVIDVCGPKPFDFALDGEMLYDTHFHIEQLDKAIRFVTP